ncbi:MAG: hypothetical protein IJ374_08770 [Lachnospiraceae bacterium]|nr:hypothetical protein [Lachnospiraceae bacterium]
MREKNRLTVIVMPVLVLAVVLCFLTGLSNLESGHRTEGKAQLEDALRRTAVSCYAAEGVYPPSLEYMQEHYGIRFDEERYMVDYQVIASNLMPDITVLELDHED